MKTNTTNTTAIADERKETFSALLQKFAEESKDTTTATYTDTLTELATAVAYSVLKKCIDPQRKNTSGQVSNSGYNTTLVSIRNELTSAKATLANTSYCNNNAVRLTYNEDGDMIEEVINKDLKNALTTLASATIGDGYDLVNTAIVSILEEVHKQAERGESIDLEKPYTVRRLKKKVWIKSVDSVDGWETVETSPIREIYKSVRRYINQTGALSTDAKNGYLYIEDISKDSDSGESEAIYRRLSKYSDLGGYACDFNGACTFYSADEKTADDYESMIAKLNLTKRQAQVLQLRTSGYGCVAIGTYLGVREESVRSVLMTIQKKATEKLELPDYIVKAMTAPTTTAKKKLTEDDKDAIRKMIDDGHSMKFVADIYNVSKMTISRIINGRKDR